MKTLICHNVTLLECNVHITGETNEEIKDAMLVHLQEDHPEDYDALTEEELDELDEVMDELLSSQWNHEEHIEEVDENI